jgi:hypothetical protein
LRKFIVKFFTIATPLHAITAKGKSFHWGNTQQREFEDLNKKINDAPMLVMPNFQRSFKLEIDASEYALGTILMQGGRPVCYHS